MTKQLLSVLVVSCSTAVNLSAADVTFSIYSDDTACRSFFSTPPAQPIKSIALNFFGNYFAHEIIGPLSYDRAYRENLEALSLEHTNLNEIISEDEMKAILDFPKLSKLAIEGNVDTPLMSLYKSMPERIVFDFVPGSVTPAQAVDVLTINNLRKVSLSIFDEQNMELVLRSFNESKSKALWMALTDAQKQEALKGLTKQQIKLLSRLSKINQQLSPESAYMLWESLSDAQRAAAAFLGSDANLAQASADERAMWTTLLDTQKYFWPSMTKAEQKMLFVLLNEMQKSAWLSIRHQPSLPERLEDLHVSALCMQPIVDIIPTAKNLKRLHLSSRWSQDSYEVTNSVIKHLIDDGIEQIGFFDVFSLQEGVFEQIVKHFSTIVYDINYDPNWNHVHATQEKSKIEIQFNDGARDLETVTKALAFAKHDQIDLHFKHYSHGIDNFFHFVEILNTVPKDAPLLKGFGHSVVSIHMVAVSKFVIDEAFAAQLMVLKALIGPFKFSANFAKFSDGAREILQLQPHEFTKEYPYLIELDIR